MYGIVKSTQHCRGVDIVFTFPGKELTTLKTKIPNGLNVQGKIRLLGLDLYVECTLAYNPVKFALKVEMSPIKIANGLIALQLSKSEPDKGPLFQAQISASGVKIKIKAFVTVLGISVGTTIDVTDEGFEFSISGNLFDVIRADVTLKSKYSDIKSANFEVGLPINCLTPNYLLLINKAQSKATFEALPSPATIEIRIKEPKL